MKKTKNEIELCHDFILKVFSVVYRLRGQLSLSQKNNQERYSRNLFLRSCVWKCLKTKSKSNKKVHNYGF